MTSNRVGDLPGRGGGEEHAPPIGALAAHEVDDVGSVREQTRVESHAAAHELLESRASPKHNER